MKRLAIGIILGPLVATTVGADEAAPRKRRPLPHEYGQIVIANHSEAARLAPVVFDHWRHRAAFTCRVCHVDIGFAMKAGTTDIRAVDNMSGHYCGACHNGRTRSAAGTPVFESCTRTTPGEGGPACVRCHSLGKLARSEADFLAFARKLPRERFGNGIDWEKAEAEKLIEPADQVEGLSIRRAALPAQKDFALGAKLEGMPNIIFSHAKHTVWNGCELCHPEIFPIRRGARETSMVHNFEGRSCGACHATVAFPLTDCQRCHTAPVR